MARDDIMVPGPPDNPVFVRVVSSVPAVVGQWGDSIDIRAEGFLAGTDRIFGEAAGVFGSSNGAGVYGNSEGPGGTGVHGRGGGDGGFGVRGEIVGSGGAAIKGQVFGPGSALAGQFIGDVEVTGKINAPQSTITCFDVSLSGSDCAENFDIAGSTAVEPGSVMVIDNEGTLRPCEIAYDKKVSGVISGAGAFKPGITLGHVEVSSNRQPIALVGKVYCKVDAEYGAIEVGDLLTTSPTPGHAMKATDQQKAFGAVIGKALRPLNEGLDLIPILIALQ